MDPQIRSRRSRGASSTPDEPAHDSTRGGGIPWRDIAIFTFLAYGITWGVSASLLSTIGDSLSSGETPSEYEASGVVGLAMFSPALAAVVMRLFVSKEGLRGSLGPSRQWRYYAIAWLVPPVLITAVVGVVVLTGAGDFTSGASLLKIYVLLLLVGVPVSTVLAFGEEYGWRGYLLPKLLPLGEVRASLVVALIWGPWHLPLLLAGLNYPGEDVLAVLAVFMASVIVLSLLFTRLFVASAGSVLVVAVAHGSLNAFSDRLTDIDHLSGSPLIVSGGGVVGVAVMAVAALVAYLALPRIAPAGRLARPVGAAEPH
jgi:CAAX protease family protein